MRAALLVALVGCNAVLDNHAGHLVDAPIEDASLPDRAVTKDVLDASVDAAPACANDLSNIGGGDFRIAFTVTTTANGPTTALLNQRALCGFGYFWDIRLGDGVMPGRLDVQTDDGVNFNEVATVLEVDDGHPHAVIVTRHAGTLAVAVDGAPAQVNVMATAAASEFPALPPLREGVDVCESVDGTARVSGALAGVCVQPQ